MPRYRVLIVDDQRDVRQTLRAGLETLGQDIQVTDVPSGEEAILVLSRQPINLLVADVRLPGISGLELKERAMVRNPQLKFIIITGLTDTKIRQTIASSGVDAYFFKPISMVDFLSVTESLLGITAFQTAVEKTEREKASHVISEEAQELEEADVVEEIPPHGLSERLARLRQDIQAICVVLVDDRGQNMAQAGILPTTVHEDSLIPAIMAIFSASAKVSHALGNEKPEDLMYFAARPYEVFLSHVGHSLGLLVVLENISRDAGQIWRLNVSISQAVEDLLSTLSGIGIRVEAVEATPITGSEGEVEKEAALPIDLPELDALFARAEKGKLKAEDVDAFWDALDSDKPDQLTRADAITYEQARQLGLAPEEGTG